jgi:hypothetical protein
LDQALQNEQDMKAKFISQVSVIWQQTLQQFPLSVLDVSAQEKTLGFAMTINLPNTDPAVGHLTHLVQSAARISQLSKAKEKAGEDTNLELNETMSLDEIFSFIVSNEYALNVNLSQTVDLSSLAGSPTGGYNLAGVNSRVIQWANAGIIPQQTQEFIHSLFINPDLQNILQQYYGALQNTTNSFESAEDQQKGIDPGSKDPSKRERCFSNKHVFNDYPYRSEPLKKLLSAATTELEDQVDSFEGEARRYHKEFVESSPSDPKNKSVFFYIGGEPPANYVSSLVRISGISSFDSVNEWTEGFFEKADQQDDKKARLDALRMISGSCYQVADLHKPKDVPKVTPQTSLQSVPQPTNKNYYLKMVRHIDRSRFYLEILNLPGGGVEGHIYISEDLAKPLKIKALCFALGGFCTSPSVRTNELPTVCASSSTPALLLDMPTGGTYPPKLGVPIRCLEQKPFNQLLKDANFQPE